VAEYGLRQPFCGFVCRLWSNAAENLRPKPSVSKDGVCFGFVSSDRSLRHLARVSEGITAKVFAMLKLAFEAVRTSGPYGPGALLQQVDRNAKIRIMRWSAGVARIWPLLTRPARICSATPDIVGEDAAELHLDHMNSGRRVR
jgi:hypothetical protein